jgi:RNA polymerase sigma-70 factor (ECF subfamily)
MLPAEAWATVTATLMCMSLMLVRALWLGGEAVSDRRPPGRFAGSKFSAAQMSKLDPPSIGEIHALTPYIRKVLKSRGVPPRDRLDLVQSVLIGAWEAITSGRYQPNPAVGLRGWVGAIARRQASNYLRSARVRRERLTEPDELAKSVDQCAPDELLARAHDQRMEQEMLTELFQTGDEMRSVLVAHDIDGLTMEQIADERQVSLATVYRWRAAAIACLQKTARQRVRE